MRSLKKSGLQRDSNPWPPRYRCDALPTELWSHTLGAWSIYWVHIFPCIEVMRSMYEIIHICTAVVYEVKSDHRSKFKVDLAPNVWLHSSVGRASHRYRGGHGFESRWSPDFFRLLISNCLSWKIYCDDHSSLHIQPQYKYELFHIYFTKLKKIEIKAKQTSKSGDVWVVLIWDLKPYIRVDFWTTNFGPCLLCFRSYD